MATNVLRESRAVERSVEAGNSAICKHCDQPIKFQAKVRLKQVIANVYDEGVWRCVEHYHFECYTTAGEPYGSAAA